MNKKCTVCNEDKDIGLFYKKGKYNGSTLYTSKCKKCFLEKYIIPNSENKKEYAKKYRLDNRDLWLESKRKYKENNKEKIKEYNSKVKDHTNARIKNWRKEKIKNDELYKAKESIRKLITSTFRRLNKIKSSKSFDILGCSKDEFIIYIESKFTYGMNWNNYGFYGWHFDHIVPVCSAKTEEDLLRLNHYTNFQPLWWKDNLTKNGKY